MSKNCCKDKAAYFKVKDNHQSSNLLKSPAASYKVVNVVLPVFESGLLMKISEKVVLNYHAPPVLYDNPLYLKHKVLLI